MASTQATIDLVVRGSGAVNRLIQDVNQLQSAVDKINSRTLDVATKTLNSNVREIETRLKNIGTASDPRPEIAKRATELTKQQTRATREYEAAINRQSRALEGAVRAEQDLAERRQRRTKTDSNAERQVVERLNKNIAAYRSAENEVGQLLGRFRSIGRQFAEIQRASAEIRVPTLGQLINANKVAATQRSIRALAQEFNRLGDSAQIGADETRARTDLSNQRVQFDRLADQLTETRARAQALREELAAIGRNERLIGPLSPNIAAVVGEGFNTDAIRSLMEAKKAEPQNEQIRERNQTKQRRRAEIRTQLRDDITLINQLETEAVQAGDAVVETQKRLANIVDFRYRNDVTGNETSLNKIQAQAESLALVANNSNIASNAFRQYTVAAEVASIKLARAQQQSFSALAAGFSTTGGIQIPEGLRQPEMIAGARNLVGQVLTEMPTVATGASNAALGAYINMLQSLQALVPMLSVEFRALEEGIARANEEMRSAQLDIVNAPSTRLGSLQAVTQQERFRQREEKVAQKRIQDGGKLLEKQIDLRDQIDKSKFLAAEKDQLRLKLEEAFVRLSNDQLESATGLTNEVSKQIKAKEALLKVKPAQVFGIEGQQFSPVTGKSKTGEIYPGSPAAQEQIAKEQNKAFKERLKNEQVALEDLVKYTEQAERNAQKLQASYDRLDLTQALDEVLADMAAVEQAADNVLKKLEMAPGGQKSALKDFDERLKAAEQIDREERKSLDRRLENEMRFGKEQVKLRNQVELEKRKAADRALDEESKRNKAALNDLKKYTQEAQRSADKLEDLYRREKRGQAVTQAIDEYLTGLSSIEKAGDRVLKSLATVPGTGADAGKDFLNRLEDAVQRRKMPDKQSTQLLALENLQKRLVEVEIDGVNVAENKARVEKLISDIKSGQIPATKQSADLIQKELRDAGLRLRISQSQAKIDGKIADVLKGSVGGPSKKINDLAAQLKYAADNKDVYQKTEDLLTRIRKAAIPESQKLALSANVDQARNELYEHRLESAQLITKEVEKQLKLETALQASASKKDWTRNSWQIALARGEEIRQEMKGERAAEASKAFNQIVAQQRALGELRLKYNAEEQKGVKFLNEKAQLHTLLNGLAKGEVGFTLENSRLIGENIKFFRDLLRIRILEAKAAGEYQGPGSKKPATAEQLEARRERLLNLARGGLSQLIDLEKKGVVVSNERLQVEQAINGIQAIRNKASEQELETLARQVVAARNYAGAMASQLKARAIPGVGLQAALQSLQEARQSRQQFLGTMSPAEGIDKIVREFNAGRPAAGEAAGNIIETFASGLKKGATSSAAAAKAFATAATQAINKAFGIKSPSRFMIELVENLVSTYISEMQKSYPRIQAATEKAFGQLTPERAVKKLTATSSGFSFADMPSAGYRPLPIRAFDPSGAGGEMDEMFRRFRNQIAALTTQPSIYRNLLNALPSSRITTDIAGAANRRALASEIPSFMPMQRMLGSGELEQVIAKAAADYFRTVRTPDPWVGLVGDYRKNFVDKIIASTQKINTQLALPAGRPIAGALPPALFASGLSPAQKLRRMRAYQRSEERAASVMGESTSRQLALPAGRVVDAAVSAAQGGLRNAISGLFDRISNAIGGVFGGGGGPRPPVGGLPGAAGGAGGGGGQAQQVANLLGLDSLGDISRISTRELEALSATFAEMRAVLDPTIQGFDRLDNQLRQTIGNIDRQLERRAPDADFLTRRFGPRTGRGISEGLIGGAFPLLFGQGLGASVGGGLGGFGGGFLGGGLGFGLSLIGTALGSAFDAAVQSATELGAALVDTSKAFDLVKDRALFSSKETEKLATRLSEMGFAVSAATLAQQEIINKVGVAGYRSLTELANSSDRLGRAWSELNLQLQAALAGPMAGLLNWVAEAVGIANKRKRSEAEINDIVAGLPKEKQVDFLKNFQSRIGDLFQSLGPASLSLGGAFGGPLQLDPSFKDDIFSAKQNIAQSLKKFSVKSKVELKVTDEQTSKMLNAIDSRNEAIDNARKQREQQIAEIRKQAIEAAARIEESFADKRKQIEREIEDIKRRRADTAIDADLRLRELRGEDPAVIKGERELLAISREDRDDRIKLQRRLDDEEQEQAKVIAEFQKGVAKQIQDANLASARAIGEAQSSYAKQVAKIIEEGSDKAGKRLAKAAEMVSLYAQRSALNASIGGATGLVIPERTNGVYSFGPQGGRSKEQVRQEPLFEGLPTLIDNLLRIDDRLEKLKKDLNMSRKPGIGQQFTALLGAEGAAAQQGASLFGTGFDVSKTATNFGTIAAASILRGVLGDPVILGASSNAQIAQATNVKAGDRVGYYESQSPKADAPSIRGVAATTQIRKALRNETLRELDEQKAAQLRNAFAAAGEDSVKIEQSLIEQNKLLNLQVKHLNNGVEPSLARQLAIVEDTYNRNVADLENRRNFALQQGYNAEAVEKSYRTELKLLGEVYSRNINLTKEYERQNEFLQNRAALIKQFAVTGVAEGAGFFGAGASAYTAELLRSGDPSQATELAQRARALEVKQAIAGIRGELNSLIDPINQVISAFGSIESNAGAGFASIAKVLTQDVSAERKTLTDRIESLSAERRYVEAKMNEPGKLNQTASNSDLAKYQQLSAEIAKANDELNNLSNSSKKVQAAIADMFRKIADDFLDMASKIIAKQLVMIAMQNVLKIFGLNMPGGFSDLGAPGNINNPLGVIDFFDVPKNANGAVFGSSITPFAMGGAFSNSIVSSPTLFKFADGGTMNTGLMGEAGPEAIMPLTRGPGGRLGVDASGAGGGDINVTVNVDAKGSSVEGNEQRGAALGRVISAAVQSEIVKQKRPGGLLA